MILLLIGYMVLFVHRPFEVWPILAEIRLERVYMVIVLTFSIASGRLIPQSHVINRTVVAFAACVLLSWLISPWSNTESSQLLVIEWLKILVFYVLVISFCRNRSDLNMLLMGIMFATGLYVTHSVYEYHLGRHQFSMGVRRLLGINETLRHANSFAAVAMITMPFAFFVFKTQESKVIRAGMIGYVVIAIYGVILTSSRMGIIGILGVGGLMVLQSQHRVKLLTAAIIVASASWPLLTENKQNRILSIVDSSYAPENAKDSADTRVESLWIGVDLFKRYPITGSGPGSWKAASGSELVSHSLYGQLIGELGLLGSMSFFALILVCLSHSRRLWNAKDSELLSDEDIPYFTELGKTLFNVFLIMLLFGFAGGTLFRYFWIWNTAFVVVASIVFQDELWLAAESVDADSDNKDVSFLETEFEEDFVQQ